MKYKVWLISLLIFSSIYCYQRQNTILFIKNNTLEINTPFLYKKYIKNINGNINKVTYSTNLNNTKLGTYQVLYYYNNHIYPYSIKVVDTIKPTIKELSPLTIINNQSYKLTDGLKIDDNSKQYNLTINNNNLNLNKEGTYQIIYHINDLSNNKTTYIRNIKVIKQIGTPIESNNKIVYLTFDDGPSNNTLKILNILDKYHIKATFFVTGCNQKYNKYIKLANDKGHTIGMHSYCHEYDQIYCSKEAFFNDLNKLRNMLYDILGYYPKYLRFPGGSSNKISKQYCNNIMTVLTKEVIKQGYQYYDWNGDTNDASSNNVSRQEIITSATSETHNNIVLLAHDTSLKNTTVEALESIINYYLDLGYDFKAIDDNSYYIHHHINN